MQFIILFYFLYPDLFYLYKLDVDALHTCACDASNKITIKIGFGLRPYHQNWASGPATTDLAFNEQVAVWIVHGDTTGPAVPLVVGIE